MTEWKGSSSPGATSPLASWTLGTVRHHRLSLPVWEARTADSAFARYPARRPVREGIHGCDLHTVRRSGRPQEDDHGVCDRAWGKGQATEGDPSLRHDD